MVTAMSIRERLLALRKEMERRRIDIYLIPTADFHESEYVGPYFKAREYITGFTGSAGTAVIFKEAAGLFTDGRYFLQAEEELLDSGIELYRSGEENVPSIEELIEEKLPDGGRLGFDGRVVNAAWGRKLKTAVEKKGGSLYTEEDLIGIIWKERPALSVQPVYRLKEQYTGESTDRKLKRLREEMKRKEADVHILTSLCDIAWLFNIRGNDMKCVPVPLSYLTIRQDTCEWFIHEQILDEELAAYLAAHNITVKPYEEIQTEAEKIGQNERVLLDMHSVSFGIVERIPKGVGIVEAKNPTVHMKAVKNPTEIANTRQAHLSDAIAVTKFIYWLKNNIGKKTITECSAIAYLEERRREQNGYIGPSFDTICAYGDHAAKMHYAADPNADTLLLEEGFLLVDSGGHYLTGTTDITRTIVLGPLTQQMKEHYTAVCRANLNLAYAKFLYGASGISLDILAREPLWELGIDYKCGTGHGVGHILNVHEGPNAFRYKINPDSPDAAALEEGMITTDEPGVYREGLYGIRIENELLCKKAQKNENGQFMEFEIITYVPIDLDAILPEQMNEKERRRLNEYHRVVYEKLADFLDEDERAWLLGCTREI